MFRFFLQILYFVNFIIHKLPDCNQDANDSNDNKDNADKTSGGKQRSSLGAESTTNTNKNDKLHQQTHNNNKYPASGVNPDSPASSTKATASSPKKPRNGFTDPAYDQLTAALKAEQLKQNSNHHGGGNHSNMQLPNGHAHGHDSTQAHSSLNIKSETVKVGAAFFIFLIIYIIPNGISNKKIYSHLFLKPYKFPFNLNDTTIATQIWSKNRRKVAQEPTTDTRQQPSTDLFALSGHLVRLVCSRGQVT